MRFPTAATVTAPASSPRGLDGDLTEFDAALLRAHLRECAACAEVGAAMGEITERVRHAPPDGAAPPVRRRRGRSGARDTAAATAVAIAAAAAAAGARRRRRLHATSAAQRAGDHAAELAPLDHQFRSIHEGKPLLVLPPPRVRSPHASARPVCRPVTAGAAAYSVGMALISAVSSRA